MSDAGKLPVAKTYQPREQYLSLQRDSLQDPESFWAKIADQLDWHRKWDEVLKWDPPFAQWFVGGLLNASENAVDKHVKSSRKSKAAYLWEGENGERRTITYGELYREVNRLASVLQNLGLQKGDTVAIYMPLVPEFPIAMLACARIGLPFTVVFSGFSAKALAERIQDCEAKIVLTADGGYRRGKVLELKTVVDDAVRETPSVKHIVVFRRTGHVVPMIEGRDYWWHDLMANASTYVAPMPVESTHLLYILYTSGTTGKPKGVAHGTGGYLAFAYATQEWVFDARDDDVYWCTADIGWVTGHTYIVFGPLMEGMTGLMYEGALEYPATDRWVSIIERHGVNILYTSPTAIRSFMKNGEEWVGKHNTSSVRIMHSVGEPINPEAFRWMHRHIGGNKIPFGSTWWMTETGGILVSHTPGLYMVPMKPGTNGLAIPGIDADVVDDDGKERKPLERGYLVIRNPWPGMPLTIHKDPDRYREVYWNKFPGNFYPGDYAVRDDDGYFWILGRADEVIKVAGHRLGTYELESALIQHHAVAEAAAVAVPDELKGEVPVAFVILRAGQAPS